MDQVDNVHTCCAEKTFFFLVHTMVLKSAHVEGIV